MNVNIDQLVEIYCSLDDYYIEIASELDKLVLAKTKYKPRKPKMSYSEVMSIMVVFHLSGFRNLKHFYIHYVCKHLSQEYPDPVSYNRFVELQSKVLLPLALFLKHRALGSCAGISFVDSTIIRVCHNKRIKRNKVFEGIAEVGKSTMGWFFGFKLHIAINDKGEIINFVFTRGNCDDRDLKVWNPMSKNLFGKIYGDKGYVSKKLFNILFADGIHLVTQIKSNMKGGLRTLCDKILLRKRSLIETVNDELKNICHIEHSRHRSPLNFLVNLVAGLVAYAFLPKKPSLNIVYDKSTPVLF